MIRLLRTDIIVLQHRVDLIRNEAVEETIWAGSYFGHNMSTSDNNMNMFEISSYQLDKLIHQM